MCDFPAAHDVAFDKRKPFTLYCRASEDDPGTSKTRAWGRIFSLPCVSSAHPFWGGGGHPITVEQDEIIIDGPLLSRAFRRQARLWLLLGPLAFGVLLALALSLTPRSYTASVSVALQQPAAPSGLQGLLGGGGGGGRHYIGILKSREMADQVERRVNLQQLYGPKTVPTAQAADALLMKGIKPSDDPDGLLYVSLTLPGPPRLSRGGPAPDQIEQASAQAANAYALALKEYFLTSDSDQGSALLHGADTEVKRARADYDDALGRVLDFNRDLGRTDPRNAPTSGSPSSSPSSGPDKADDATAASGLGGLYSSLFQVEGDLRAALAARQTSQQGVAGQINNLPSVPENDPLLTDIRARVKRDQAALDTDSKILGPENPRVLTDQTRLGTDQRELERQVSGVRQNLTTQSTEADAQIQSLYAKQAELVKNIASTQRHLGISRQLSGEQGRLQTEVSLRLDYLRIALGEAAKIRLDNVSAQSRMSLVDSALPPNGGEPTSSKMAVVCLLPVLLAFLVAIAADYFRSARAKARTMPPPSANGSGPKPALEPVHEEGADGPLVRSR